MLFWVFVVLLIVSCVLVVGGFALAMYYNSEAPLPLSAIGVIVFIPTLIIVWSTWSHYASDFAKVVAQDHLIEVYQERVNSLDTRLDSFDFPDKPMVSIDKDSPWSTIVTSLSDAETSLAQAKDAKARAIRDIQDWKIGPMSGVVTLVGEPRVNN